MRTFNQLSASSDRGSPWHICLSYYWALAGFLLLPAVWVEVQSFNFLDRKNLVEFESIYKLGKVEFWTKWILIKLAGFLVFYLIMVLLQLVLRASNLSEFKARYLFAIGFFGGALVGLTQSFLIRFLGVYDTGTSFGRIFSPAPTFTFILLVLSTLHTSIDSYRVESNQAETDLNSLNNLRDSQQRIFTGYRTLGDELHSRVRVKAAEALAKVAKIDRAAVMGNLDVADEIRLISDSTIRDLSHKIASSYHASKKFDGFNLFGSRGFSVARLLRDSALIAPLDPLRFTVACALMVNGMMVRHSTLPEALVVVGVGFGLLYVIQLAGYWLFKKFHIHNIYTIVVITFASALLPYQIISSSTFIRSGIPDWDLWRPTPLSLFLIVMVMTVLGYVLQSGSVRKDELVRIRYAEIANVQVSAKEINSELVQISRNWARHLHGYVQSQILAATLMLEKAQRDDDFTAVQEAFDQIIGAFESASEYEYIDDVSLGDGLEKQISLWSEIIDIALIVPPAISERTGPQIHRAVEVVGEMIANASRHGRASSITIEITRQNPKELQIRAVDNGSRFVALSKGFGTRFFDEVSRGRWDIARNNVFGETTVSVLIDLFDSETLEPTDVPFETAV